MYSYLGMEIIGLWNRLRSWANNNFPEMLSDLQEPATKEEIVFLEEKLSLKLPDDFQQSLMIHNGEYGHWYSNIFADRGTYLPTNQIISIWEERWKVSKELGNTELEPELIKEGIGFVEGPVKPFGFLKQWIPIMDFNGDIFWALDFSPAPGGNAGQVIEVDWECVSWKVIASSFRGFMKDYVEALEAGKFHIDEHGNLTRFKA